MWLLTYGLFGLFLRYMSHPSPRWRYMADASYWIYIVHVPFVMLLPLLFANVPAPGIVKDDRSGESAGLARKRGNSPSRLRRLIDRMDAQHSEGKRPPKEYRYFNELLVGRVGIEPTTT